MDLDVPGSVKISSRKELNLLTSSLATNSYPSLLYILSSSSRVELLLTLSSHVGSREHFFNKMSNDKSCRQHFLVMEPGPPLLLHLVLGFVMYVQVKKARNPIVSICTGHRARFPWSSWCVNS